MTLAGPVALGLVVLTGCSGDPPEPDPLDSASSEAPSQSAEPTPSKASPTKGPRATNDPPALPAEADALSRAGRRAFARHLVDVMNYSVSTLDTAPLVRLSTPACAACRSIVKRLSDIRRSGGRIDGGRWSIVQVIVLRGGTNRTEQVNVAVDFARQVSVRSRDARPRRFPSGRGVFTFDLTPIKGHWRVAAIRAANT